MSSWRASLALLLALGLGAGCTWSSPSRARPTSVLVVVVDTLRADHLSLYGYERLTSPLLAERATHGAVFTRAYATSPWTLPSFASIYTGLGPSRHGAGFLIPPGGDPRHPVPAGMLLHGELKEFGGLLATASTLAETLAAAGHRTGAIANNPFLHPRFGIARGFEHYDHEPGSDADTRRADEMVDRALAWMAAQADAPFFLSLHLFDPHMNYDAPAPVRGRFTRSVPINETLPIRDTARLRQIATRLTPDQWRFIAAAYDEEIAFVDRELGRLLATMDDRGLLARTLVVVTADHGEELFDHQSFGHGHTMFEEQLRVPLVLLGAGVAPGRHDVPVSIADVAPTVLDALGVTAPSGLDGVTLWPTARRGDPPPSRAIFAERRGSLPERKSVIQWPFKLSANVGGATPWLIDLAADPAEIRDLSRERPDLLASLGAQLEGRYALDAGRAWAPAVDLDAATRERLRALGYLKGPEHPPAANDRVP